MPVFAVIPVFTVMPVFTVVPCSFYSVHASVTGTLQILQYHRKFTGITANTRNTVNTGIALKTGTLLQNWHPTVNTYNNIPYSGKFSLVLIFV